MRNYIICVIYDDAVYQYTITSAIKANNLAKKILVFPDGELALNFFIDNLGEQEHLPDVVFLDINMPVMDGWDFMESFVRLKPNIGKKITIYMITSSVDPGRYRKGWENKRIIRLYHQTHHPRYVARHNQ